MRILHCCLAAFYIDGYSYQENILPREHKKIGHEVMILASTETFIDNNVLGYIEPKSYMNEDDIKVTRLAYKKILPHSIMKKLRVYKGTEEVLYEFKPEIIFLHDLQFLDIIHVVNFVKKYPNTKVYVDCHADFSNSARTWLSKNILHSKIYRYCAKKIEPYTIVFWGVLPARVDFLKRMYKITPEKVKLLVMGAEDEKVQEARKEKNRSTFREKHNILKDDFLIVSGGKVDSMKKQTLNLMRAMKNINNKKIKLIIFGSVAKELTVEFNELCDNRFIQFIGWVSSDESYNIFAAADLVVFPGRHSVFWEQVVGLGIPMLVKYWEGTTHIDLGGNVRFLYNDSSDEIKELISEICCNPDILKKMKLVAENKGMETFSYSKIAQKSIEI
jgi:1,2-diacylglycerol 3-alpha-glucosyltransferase